MNFPKAYLNRYVCILRAPSLGVMFQGPAKSQPFWASPSLRHIPTVDGQIPAPPKTPWETLLVGIYRGSYHPRVSLVVQDFVHPQYVHPVRPTPGRQGSQATGAKFPCPAAPQDPSATLYRSPHGEMVGPFLSLFRKVPRTALFGVPWQNLLRLSHARNPVSRAQ